MLVKEDNGICTNIYVRELEDEPKDCCVRITKGGHAEWTDFENNLGSDKPNFIYKFALCQQYVHIVMPMSSFKVDRLRGAKWEIVRSNGEIIESGGLL